MPAILDAAEKHETRYCIPLHIRDAQIRTNIKKVPGRIESVPDHDGSVAIVGFGPSLQKTWKHVKKFKTIISCSGSHKFLQSKGITPTYHVEVDPREHKIDLLGEPNQSTVYLPASCCHPKYINHLLAHEAKVKLWHVFANDGESEQVIPKGEVLVTGGCDVGMRAMSIARVLGFKDFHIFGLDGCEADGKKHAGEHPNEPKGHAVTVVNGREFQTTPALLESAKMVFHELDQMADVTFKFYGDGLIQEMAKTYVRKPSANSMVAAVRPKLISDEMREMNRQLHEENAFYGSGGGKYAETVLAMKTDAIKSILDYGCGKGLLQKSLPFPIWQYDPAVPEFSESPRPADLVVCTDVLEHIEPDKLDAVLTDLKRVTLQVGYFVVHLGAAKKTYPDGRNAHLIQQPADWWCKKIGKFFDVATAQQKGIELHMVVGPKTHTETSAIVGVKGRDGVKSRFYTPNDVTRWRAETLTTKEPETIKWLESIPKGSVLWDIGANVGGYSVWAGVRGITVYSFEPEAENYALLCRNLALNNLPVNAYCVALTPSLQVAALHLSTKGAGGSCHSFGASVDPHGKGRESAIAQGCIGLPVDTLIAYGIPKPDYIKIDVDGIEPDVLKGMGKALDTVQSLLIEVNHSAPGHKAMVKDLESRGFKFDPEQVKRSTRKGGAFKGVAEHIFFRQTEVERHILEAISRAKLLTSPSPHFYVENVLPDDIYQELVDFDGEYEQIEQVRALKGYPERYVGNLPRPEWMRCFKSALLRKFGVMDQGFHDEHLLIRDYPGYKIGPHTDLPARVLSALLYLAKPGDPESLGTWLYKPNQKGFKCKQGKHYPFDQFKPAKFAPYKANSMLVFLRTDASFHGVEETDHTRNVLLYDIRR